MLPGHLIQHGTIYDGTGTAPFSADLRIRGGNIVAIAPGLPPDGDEVVDATGLIVAPGLVDLHVHVYTGMGVFALSPAQAGLRTGVTTMLDTGTAGALTYAPFEQFVMPATAEEVFALLNISMIGCIHRDDVYPYFSDLTYAPFIHVEGAVNCLRRHRAAGRLLGMKARLTNSMAGNRVENERTALYGALEAAAITGTPAMFHHVRSEVPIAELLDAMRPGDIYTHTYHGSANGPFADPVAPPFQAVSSKSRQQDHRPEGRCHEPPGKAVPRAPVDAARRARDRGILFDVGHGMGSFTWRTAEPSCQQHGFWPDTISTDLHQYCIDGPAYDMTTTMSRFLALGMPLERVIQAATHTPAAAMGQGDRLGRLAVGRQADVVLLRLNEGSWTLEDVEQQTRTIRRRLFVVDVWKRGQRRGAVGNDTQW